MVIGEKMLQEVTCTVEIKFKLLNQRGCRELFSHCFKRQKKEQR